MNALVDHAKNGRLEQVKLLVKLGVSDEYITAAISFAIINKHFKIVEYLVEMSFYDIIDKLIEKKVNMKNMSLALVDATYFNRYDMFKYLLEIGINLKPVKEEVLNVSLRHGYKEITDLVRSIK